MVGHNLWDTNNTLPLLAAQTDASGALLASYQYGPDDLPLSETTTAGVFYYHHDWQDSTSDLTDATGTPQWRYTYTAYGTTTATKLTSTAAANPLQYNGQVNDPTTGLYDLRARNYDPTLGQFTSTDPLPADTTTPDTSPYTYADDNPTVETDPSGQCGWIPGTGNSGCWDTAGGILGTPFGINPVTTAKQAFNQCVQGIIFGSHHGEGAGTGCLNEFTGVHEFERGVINQCLDQMKLGLGQMALLGAGGWEALTSEPELTGILVDLPYGDFPAHTAGVWDWINATDPNYPGTVVPKSFNLKTASGKDIWVHPNATEHILEDVYKSKVLRNAMDKQTRDLAAQGELWSLRRAVSDATRHGIVYDKLLIVDGWELKFGPPRTGPNPALTHAKFAK